MKVRIPATGLYTYPDALVVCGKAAFEDNEEDVLLNPTVIVEVLSKSTEHYDRGAKFQNYRTLPSLQEYLLIAQNEQRLEQYRRQSNTEWLLAEVTDPTGTIDMPSIGCKLALADLYDKVTMPTQPRILREPYVEYVL